MQPLEVVPHNITPSPGGVMDRALECNPEPLRGYCFLLDAVQVVLRPAPPLATIRRGSAAEAKSTLSGTAERLAVVAR